MIPIRRCLAQWMRCFDAAKLDEATAHLSLIDRDNVGDIAVRARKILGV